MAGDYRQLAGLIDLRTTFSDGDLNMESLVDLASRRGFHVLFLNDHDRMAMEYGLVPFRNTLKRRKELNSINKGGAGRYLSEVKRVKAKHPDMVIVPGSETAAFYYWTGSYLGKDLTANNHEKRLLTVGLREPADYEDLPILHNGFSLQFIRQAIPLMLLFSIPLVIGIWLSRHGRLGRVFGLFIAGLSLLSIVDTDPFRSSPFDPYHGDQGISPYQLVIDYVGSRGGLTFWNYPETKSGTRKLGPIRVHTPPYPEALLQSKDYTGFAALYGDTRTVTEPGNIWDRVLLEYCAGKRARPVWGISTADFHKDSGAGEKLGNFPTVFLVTEVTEASVLSAMRQGRMYACRGTYPQRLILKDFSVNSSDGTRRAISGEEIVLPENPRIHIELDATEKTDRPVDVRLTRAGKPVKTFRGFLPMNIDYEDQYVNSGQRIYYRMDVHGCGALISNPIFVTFKKDFVPT
jgi:hypothetical protein